MLFPEILGEGGRHYSVPDVRGSGKVGLSAFAPAAGDLNVSLHVYGNIIMSKIIIKLIFPYHPLTIIIISNHPQFIEDLSQSSTILIHFE